MSEGIISRVQVLTVFFFPFPLRDGTTHCFNGMRLNMEEYIPFKQLPIQCGSQIYLYTTSKNMLKGAHSIETTRRRPFS